MLNQELILEYENCLLGKTVTIPKYYFSYAQESNARIALSIMQYAFENYLRWDPFTLRDQLNMRIMQKLKLKLLIKYIPFPPELNPKTDLFYIVWKIYPKTIHFSETDLILKIYTQVLSGELQRFPKEFFTGIYGMVRARVCLQYLIEQYMTVNDIEELYRIFASKQGTTLLKKYKLFSVCESSFDNPVEFLHYSLPQQQKDDFLDSFYQFQMLREKEAAL